MNIDNLRYFYEVAKIGSISIVAKNNHISQSALSQQLFKLEEKLNVKLLTRSNKGATLTTEGTIVLKHCEDILESYDKIFKDLSSKKENKTTINIKADEIITSTIVTTSLAFIRNRYNKLAINLYSSPFSLNTNSNYDLDDIILSYFEINSNENRISEKLFEDELIFITNSDSINDSLNFKDLSSTPMILVQDSINGYKYLDEALKLNFPDFKKLNICLNTQSYYPALSCCNSLNALVLLPKSAYLSTYKKDGFKEIHISDLHIPLTLYINYSESLFKSQTRFIASFKNSILDSIKKKDA